MSKIALALAAAGGYVLGARAGRGRYEQIQQQASRLWSDPRVQEKRAQAKDAAVEAGAAAKDKVQEKVADARDSGTGPADHSVPTPNDMPEHPVVPGTAADGTAPGHHS